MTTTVLFLTSGTTWTVPSDWNAASNTIEAIGGGGASAPGTGSSGSGAGGGGGAYAKVVNQALTPGVAVNVQIGAGGAAGSANGTDTLLKNNAAATILLAKGGQGGIRSGSIGGAGGAAASCVPNTSAFSGGAGGNAIAGGGGGGGSAGPLGAGGQGGASTTLSTTDAGAGGGGNGGGSAGAVGNAVSGIGGAGGNNQGASGSGAGGANNGGVGADGTNGGGGGGGGNNTGTGGGAGDGGAGTEWTSTAGPTGGSGGGGGASGGTNTTGAPGNGALYGAGGGGVYDGALFGTGAPGIIVVTYTPTSSTLPEPPPAGFQYKTCDSVSPPAGALTLETGSSPPVALGDVFIVSLVTMPDSFPISVNGDGTCDINAGGSVDRQSFIYSIWRTASDSIDGPQTVWVNEVPPFWGQGVNLTTPINPTPSTLNLAAAPYAQSPSADPLVFALASGALPPGCPLDTATGLLTIAPTAFGTFNFTINATDVPGMTTESPPCSIVVSGASGTTTVPNVVGMNATDATTALVAANLTLGATTSVSSSTVDLGLVISQSPVATAIVAVGTPVALVLSSGPPTPGPPTVTVIPNLVGLTPQQATAVVNAQNLALGTVTSEYD